MITHYTGTREITIEGDEPATVWRVRPLTFFELLEIDRLAPPPPDGDAEKTRWYWDRMLAVVERGLLAIDGEDVTGHVREAIDGLQPAAQVAHVVAELYRAIDGYAVDPK